MVNHESSLIPLPQSFDRFELNPELEEKYQHNLLKQTLAYCKTYGLSFYGDNEQLSAAARVINMVFGAEIAATGKLPQTDKDIQTYIARGLSKRNQAVNSARTTINQIKSQSNGLTFFNLGIHQATVRETAEEINNHVLELEFPKTKQLLTRIQTGQKAIPSLARIIHEEWSGLTGPELDREFRRHFSYPENQVKIIRGLISRELIMTESNQEVDPTFISDENLDVLINMAANGLMSYHQFTPELTDKIYSISQKLTDMFLTNDPELFVSVLPKDLTQLFSDYATQIIQQCVFWIKSPAASKNELDWHYWQKKIDILKLIPITPINTQNTIMSPAEIADMKPTQTHIWENGATINEAVIPNYKKLIEVAKILEMSTLPQDKKTLKLITEALHAWEEYAKAVSKRYRINVLQGTIDRLSNVAGDPDDVFRDQELRNIGAKLHNARNQRKHYLEALNATDISVDLKPRRVGKNRPALTRDMEQSLTAAMQVIVPYESIDTDHNLSFTSQRINAPSWFTILIGPRFEQLKDADYLAGLLTKIQDTQVQIKSNALSFRTILANPQVVSRVNILKKHNQSYAYNQLNSELAQMSNMHLSAEIANSLRLRILDDLSYRKKLIQNQLDIIHKRRRLQSLVPYLALGQYSEAMLELATEISPKDMSIFLLNKVYLKDREQTQECLIGDILMARVLHDKYIRHQLQYGRVEGKTTLPEAINKYLNTHPNMSPTKKGPYHLILALASSALLPSHIKGLPSAVKKCIFKRLLFIEASSYIHENKAHVAQLENEYIELRSAIDRGKKAAKLAEAKTSLSKHELEIFAAKHQLYKKMISLGLAAKTEDFPEEVFSPLP